MTPVPMKAMESDIFGEVSALTEDARPGTGDVFFSDRQSERPAPAGGLKIGKGPIGLMRPDKMVIYFPTRATLEDAMGRLLNRVAGAPAQGVPFSAPLDNDGLISFGFDPARANGRARMQAPSWRRWITDRLGASFAEARPDPAATPAWRRALDRLQLDGIDVDHWMPTANFGSECP